MEDCLKKAAGKPQVPKPPEGADPKPKCKGKGGKGKKGASSLGEWPDGQEILRLMGKLPRRQQVCSLVPSVDTRVTVNETDKPGEESRNGHEISGNPTKVETCANAVDAELGERIDLTIDSGCAACALPVGVASTVGMLRELGFKTPALKFQNGDVQNLKFSVMDRLHKPLVAACKLVAAGNRIVMQPETQGGSFIGDVRSKRRKRIFERNREFTETVGAPEQVVPNERQVFIRKPNLTFRNKP